MEGFVERIFIAPEGGAPMQSVEAAVAEAGRGLAGDRYAEGRGSWSGEACHVTLIAAEALHEIVREHGIAVAQGEHRRNLVTRGLRLADLGGRRFQVGGAVLAYEQPRPPCRYLESITEPGMLKALGAGGHGICCRVVASGPIRVGDRIVLELEE